MANNNFGQTIGGYGKSIPSRLLNATSDLLSNSDFITRTIGMNNSYEDIMFIVQSLGYEPISLLGSDYLYIFDHVRRSYRQGMVVKDHSFNDYVNEYNMPKFTFYKEVPTVRFANPYEDTMNYLGNWVPNMKFGDTLQSNILISYAESDDERTNNRSIGASRDIDNANPGINMGGIMSFFPSKSSELLNRTNQNFNHGKYRTLIARFHTNIDSTKSKDDITQTAVSEKYGMSHGRNLLKKRNRVGDKWDVNGYDNPYCRVWTYHHQYNQLNRAIRPFDVTSADELEIEEFANSGYDTVGFRTPENKEFKFRGGSERLDKYGVLNYYNGMVNIAPTAKIKDYFEHKEDKEITIKKCMFSLENLAWKDKNTIRDQYDNEGLSPEQKGPLGGRIMWFPPYDLAFTENVDVRWNENEFIGRGEKIYTYTNTNRSGTLSFTMVIDHPSVIDYWTGHEDKSLIPNNDGGVDAIDNQENTLLRFFAGCEILSAKPQLYKTRTPIKDNTNDNGVTQEQTNPMVNVPDSETSVPPSYNKINCGLYYPNNYSGVNDRDTSVNPIYYLMNGIGAQKGVISGFENLGNTDIPTVIDKKISVNGGQFDEGYGGYEIRSKGISIATKILNTSDIQKTIKNKDIQYLTDENGVGYIVQHEDSSVSYQLTKIIGSKAKPPLPTGKTYTENWLHRRYYYRVDDDYTNEIFTHEESYIDTHSEQLNGKGFEKALKYAGKLSQDDLVVSFADLFIATEGDGNAKIQELFNGYYSQSRVKEMQKLFNERKIKKASIIGYASKAGYVENNKKLAINRAKTFKWWLEQSPIFKGVEISVSYELYDNKNRVNMGGASSLEQKVWRSALLTIEFEDNTVQNATVTEKTGKVVDPSGKTITDVARISDMKTKTEMTPMEFLLTTDEGKKLATKYLLNGIMDNPTWEKIYQLSGKNYGDENSWDYDDTALRRGISVSEPKVVERYDNEGEFFKLLSRYDPFLHHTITEKIKYFDPAYHAISPEGFNARLTFLHQCTRQGPTVGAGEGSNSTAYNLSFGRPPICVLRLGDFYNTKIVINRVGITYENATWDTNPEGIGVMPMFAKIDLSFYFIGGSDLGGPISRLQNAVSFNYYANTSVYDNRAEMVQYDNDGSGKEVLFKPFAYPDMKWDKK